MILGNFAFSQCSFLSQVTFVNGLTVIGFGMFAMSNGHSNPTFLKTVTIPSTVTTIGSQAFAFNAGLNCVHWVGNIITTPTDIFLKSSNAIACSFIPSAIPSANPSNRLTDKQSNILIYSSSNRPNGNITLINGDFELKFKIYLNYETH